MTTPVIVVWADAHTNTTTWTAIEDLDQEEYLVETCGFLLATCDGGKPEHVTVYQSKTPDGEVDGVLNIPVGMVRQLKICGPQTLVK